MKLNIGLMICLWVICVDAEETSNEEDLKSPASGSSSTSPKANQSSGGSSVTFLKNERTPLDASGHYRYDIELSDGTKFSQEGATEAPQSGENDTAGGGIVIRGSYSYLAPDGTPVHLTYVADKGGFQPVSDSIPKPVAQSKSSKNSFTASTNESSASADPPLETISSSLFSSPEVDN